MRIHHDILTPADMHRAVAHLDRVQVDYSGGGSRTRNHAFDVRLYAFEDRGPGKRRRVNVGTSHTLDRFDRDYAATWDEWGIFLAHLFAVDPNLVVGGNYSGLDHFQWCTGKRYVGLSDPDAPLNVGTPCDNHQWEWDHDAHHGHSMRCSKGCGAQRRRVTGGDAFLALFERRWGERKYPIPTIQIGA